MITENISENKALIMTKKSISLDLFTGGVTTNRIKICDATPESIDNVIKTLSKLKRYLEEIAP